MDILFPRFCLICPKEGAYICDRCEVAFDPLPFILCPVCSKKIADGIICKNCRKNSGIGISRFFTALSYKNKHVRLVIQKAKYKPYFARELLYDGAKFLLRFLRHHKFSDLIAPFITMGKICIIPIPLHKRKLRMRSFNQAEVIADIIASEFSIPLLNRALLRVRHTESQTAMNPLERKINVKNAFLIGDQIDLRGKIVILVDDVYTSGSTMNECAKIIKAAGAKEIWGITLAK